MERPSPLQLDAKFGPRETPTDMAGPAFVTLLMNSLSGGFSPGPVNTMRVPSGDH